MDTDDRPTLIVHECPTTMVYERPTLTAAGSFKKSTGMGGSGPRDLLVNKQLL